MKQEFEYTDEERAALDALTPKQRGFTLHWIEHGSPKQAMIANYKVDPNNPRLAQRAHDMMRENPKIQHAIEVFRRGMAKRNDLSLDGIIAELVGEVNDAKEIRKTLINLAVNGDMNDKFILRRIDKLTLIDKNRDIVGALRQISKMLGYEIPKKVEQTNNLIQINIIRPKKE